VPEVDVILANIIRDHMGIDGSRIALYNQNFNKPKDDDIFIVIATENKRVVGNVFNFDSDADEEVLSTTIYTTLNIEITSRDDSAKLRNHEILMAINSTLSQQAQEENNIRIYRTGSILDLSTIDGASALYRYQIPVIISHVEIKRTAITPVDKFQPITTEVERNG